MKSYPTFVLCLTATSMGLCAVACRPPQPAATDAEAHAPTSAPPGAGATVVPPPVSPASPATPTGPAATPADGSRRLALSGDQPVPVPQSNLRVCISAAWHKSRAPVVGVSILVEQAGQPAPHKAEVSWTIETGRIDSGWRKLEGRRFDEASNTYVEEHIEGWLVRLDSVDAQSAGGDPAAITVSFKPAP